jgi:hypothetical protein
MYITVLEIKEGITSSEKLTTSMLFLICPDGPFMGFSSD